MKRELFIKEIEKLNVSYTKEKLKKLEEYCEFLIEYNKHTNLTAIKEVPEIYLKHFYDSLTLTKIVDLNSIRSMVDVGTGAGFPGIVIKIFYPDINMVLIDSNNKKTTFLKLLVDKLKLTNIEIINDRVENYSINNLNKFDLATARAVTNMRPLSELIMPLVKEGGVFIAMKGDYKEELKEASETIEIMGGIVNNIIEFDMYGKRSLIEIKKVRNSNIKEIRSYDKIIKKPLRKTSK